MTQDDAAVLRLAEAIADGTRIDWEAELEGHPELASLAGKLQRVEAIVAAHRAEVERGLRADPELGRDASLTRWGPLTILEKLGEGAFGEVFRAFDPELEREVALKLCRAPSHPDGAPTSAEERFLTEARRLARVRHANVLTVHGAGRHDGRAGMWTDLLEGRTLESVLAEQGVLGPREAALVGQDLCRALAGVHGAGLIHRDLKAANVMRETGGRIVLMDFGAVEPSVLEPEHRGHHGSEPISLGTPLAAAPETLRGEPAEPPADLYALGVLLYRLTTGHYPVEAISLEELRAKHERGDSVPLRDRRPDLPSEFVAVVSRALAKDPSRRYPSAGAMEHALAEALGAPGLGAPGHSAFVPAGSSAAAAGTPARGDEALPLGPRARGASGRGVVLASIAAAALLVAAMFFYGRTRDGGHPRTDSRGASSLPAAGQSGAEFPASRGADKNGSLANEAREDEPSTPGGRKSMAPLSGAGSETGSGPAGLRVTASLFRASNRREERLLPGARIEPGDDLFLEIQGSRPMHVFVLDEDTQGAVFVLYPSPELDTKNPLAADVLHILPGPQAGKPFHWQVSSAGGRETILVIASSRPLCELERELAALPHATADATALSGEATVTRPGLRGISKMTRAAPRSGTKGRSGLAALLGRLPAHSDAQGQDPWTWQIDLENPRP